MTDDRLPLAELMAKTADSDFLRSVAESVLQIIMEADLDGLIGAGRHERSGERSTWRNGYRNRSLDTRLGTLNLKIPKLRTGAYFPGFLEPRKTVEKALVSVIQEAWIAGVSTRRVDELVQAMGMSGISKSSVSKLCKDIDERVNAFLNRPLAGEWPYFWLDPTYLKVREGGRIVSVAAIIAVAVTTEGKREIVGLHIGPSEAEPFWTTFLKDFVWRGPNGVKLVISDAHEGLKASITRVVAPPGSAAACTSCAMPLRMCQRARTPWPPPRSGRSSSSPITPRPPRPGITSPTSSAPDGLSSEPAWMPLSTTCSPT
ncbi:transposase-like protein [Novosphingobium chloroacetimidivorans]|uniref:Mutator family transposase n=1 Tax=Novosphingobium chloroacetimidivorans TaxID=1428314 RepID=A0A7W7KEP6_9SPHN|nr:transposase-like protein [Novosphingobium chloroacetimidivorans]